MSQWIRWKGVIPFVLITTGLTLFFLLFLDSLVKNLIESTGTDMLGARVETRHVDIHLSPLGITIDGLQVTNPDKPMSNAVEIAQIRFGLAADQLLMGKVIIEQMDVAKVRFDTPRSNSGAVSTATVMSSKTSNAPTKDSVEDDTSSASTSRGKADDSGMQMPSLDLPDVDAILAREPLETQKQADAITASITNVEQDWKTLQLSLPNETRTNHYDQRVASLAKTRPDDIKQLGQALTSLQSLKVELNADLGKINQARKQAQQGLDKLDTDYQALLKAPRQDKNRLTSKYTPDAQGVGNLSQLLFGHQAGGYLQQGLLWYQKLAPMLSGDGEEEEPEAERSKGKEIRFRENNPSPDFLIQRIIASVQTTQGHFEGQILDVTHQPEIIRRPVSFVFKGQQMSGMDSLHIDGKLDHIDRKNSLDLVTMEIKGYHVSHHKLSNDPQLQLQLRSALSDTRMKAEHRNGILQGDMNIHIKNTQYDNRASGGEFQQVLVKAFNTLSDFNIDTHLSGSLTKPRLRIRSDLDKRLNKQISAAFDRRVKKYQQELGKRLRQATDKQITPVRNSITTLRADIDARLNVLEAPFKRQQKAVEQQTHQFQARIDAETRKAEQAVKSKLKSKARDLLKQFQR